MSDLAYAVGGALLATLPAAGVFVMVARALRRAFG